MNHNIATALLERARPITDLHPHPRNARRRDPRARAELRDSLTTNGQYKTVTTRRLPDGTLQLLVGHGTTAEAADLGWTHVAVDVLEGVTDEQAARIVAVDNRTSDLATYDDEALLELLAEIGMDLTGSGYSPADIREIEANNIRGKGTPAAFTNPDFEPPPPAAPISRLGDVWELGPHRLVVGDGTDPAVVDEALTGRRADLYVTDPPYNVAYTGGTAEALTIANDDLDEQAFAGFLAGLFTAAAAHAVPGAPAYVFHADTAGAAFRRAFVDAGWGLHQVLIWAKDRFVLGRQDHHWQHEPILYGWLPGARHPWYGGRTLATLLDDKEPVDLARLSKAQLLAIVTEALDGTSVIRADRPTVNLDHPTKKPVELLVRLLERSSRPGAIALDTCAGSGTLAIACHTSVRQAALVELDPAYGDVIARRYQAHTGITPVRVTDGAREPLSFLEEVQGG